MDKFEELITRLDKARIFFNTNTDTEKFLPEFFKLNDEIDQVSIEIIEKGVMTFDEVIKTLLGG